MATNKIVGYDLKGPCACWAGIYCADCARELGVRSPLHPGDKVLRENDMRDHMLCERCGKVFPSKARLGPPFK